MTTYLLDVSPAEAVAAGAQLLDEKLPGWWQKITLEDLDLNDCSACVCGQLAMTAAVEEFRYSMKVTRELYNQFDATLAFLGLTWNGNGELEEDSLGYDFEYGFNADTRDFNDLGTWAEREAMSEAMHRTFRALDEEWQLVIRTRLEADRLPVWAPQEAEQEITLA